MSPDWAQHLASGPRENGTPELQEAALWLAEELRRIGLPAESLTYEAHPWKLRILGCVALLGAALYIYAMLKKLPGLALAVSLGVSLFYVLELDFGVPVLGFLDATPQQNVVTTVASSRPATARLVFSAHYDSKTDLLDHVERAPINFLGLPFTLLMLLGAGFNRRPKLVKAGVAAAALNGLGLFLAQTGGAFVSARSPGAIDDGAGCAVLLELGRALKARPLEQTEVKLAFFSGEEVGFQGARAYAAIVNRALPLQVINLDGVGLSSELSLFRSESGVLKSYPPDPKLVAAFDAVKPLYRAPWPATTDARAFLEAGIPALNVSSELPDHWPPRNMHSRLDTMSRVDTSGLEATVQTLVNVARQLDAARREN